ncbi:putative Thermitase [Candidatus Zixiibacteriota bacterium]|nr:putative Thermitase [candidate division Zixibacteria bacterium]
MSLRQIITDAAIIALSLIPNSFALYNPGAAKSPASSHPARLIVKFQDGAMPKAVTRKGTAISTGLVNLDRLNRQFQVINLAPLPAAGKSDPGSPLDNVAILTPAGGADLTEMAAAYKALPEVAYAEPEYEVELYGEPNDTLYAQQWALHNSGQPHYAVFRIDGPKNDELISVSGISGADIHADTIYQAPPDNTATAVVAILDTGVDMAHPDLAAHIWTNPGEIPGNGIDDDHNGYIDDIHGWDFGGDGTIGTIGDDDPTDDFGHGTHLAGIAAAVTDNTIGIAGINPHALIMPLKFDPLPLTTYVASGIVYAADNGADVINMSFGMAFQSQLVEDALIYAHNKGVILCAASGNDFTEKLNFPASVPEVMAVGASNDSDHVTSFSTYGSNIAFIAPGDGVLSLRAAGTDMYGTDYPQEPGVHIIDTNYYLASGTSMACPHAVGIASYLRSVSPGLTPDRVRDIMQQTADDITDPYGVGWNLPGWDKYSGYGRLNLFRALQAAPRVRARIVSPLPNAVVSGSVTISGTADGDDFTGYALDYGSGDIPSSWIPITSSAIPVTDGPLGTWETSGLNGLYTLRLQAGNDNYSYYKIYVVNQTAADITGPGTNDTLTNSATIYGNAYCPDFSLFLLEYGAGVNPAQWDTLAISYLPAFDSPLGAWISDKAAAGDYTIRLTVNSLLGPVRSDSIFIHNESIFAGDRGWKVPLGGTPTIVPNYADIDHDGQNEIIVGTSNGIKIFHTDGTEQTDSIPSFPPNNYAIPIAVGNLDGDGIDDYVALGYDPPIVYGYPSGAPSFKNYLGILPGVGSSLYSEHELPKLFLKDIDGDGLDEINILIYNGSLSKAFIMESDGTMSTVLDHFSVYLPADLNGDGKDELYVATENFGLLKQYDYATGTAVDSVIIQLNDSPFNPSDFSAYDINNDGRLELIVYGYYNDYGYRLYAFDAGFHLLPGWPHDMHIDNFVVPTTPIFGDINGDGQPEYFSTYFDLSASYIMAWNIDGTPFVTGSPGGYFAMVPGLSVLNMLTLADMNGDGTPDLLACAINDIFFTYQVQRLYCWDSRARIVDGFPLISETGVSTYLRYTPIVGDINKDGKTDLIMTSSDSSLIFVNYPAVDYDPCHAPVPIWRYDRSFSGIGKYSDSCRPVDVPENPESLPGTFALQQNYPNPFNAATEIEFNLPVRSDVSIVVYDILGRKVKLLTDGNRPAGKYRVRWDGTNQSGQPVASGVYFYRIKAGEFVQAKKMVMLK